MPSISAEKWLPLSYDALRDKNVNLFKKLNSVIFPLQYKARLFAIKIVLFDPRGFRSPVAQTVYPARRRSFTRTVSQQGA